MIKKSVKLRRFKVGGSPVVITAGVNNNGFNLITVLFSTITTPYIGEERANEILPHFFSSIDFLSLAEASLCVPMRGWEGGWKFADENGNGRGRGKGKEASFVTSESTA